MADASADRARTSGAKPGSANSPVAALRQGQAGWVLLAALGISCVIPGEFAAWNWGLAYGGWGGMLVAILLVAIMIFCLAFCIAELACIIPTAGGGYGFARSAFGPLAGFLTGTAVTIEYMLAAAVIAIFIEAYFAALTGIHGWAVPTVCFILACGLHCLGVGAAMRVVLTLLGFAVLAIVLFLGAAAPHADARKLFDIEAVTHAVSSSRFLPFGLAGVWTALPFAVAGFAGMESIPLASEEARDPLKNIPRALIFGLALLLSIMLALLYVAPAVMGSAALSRAASPLVDALVSIGSGPVLRFVTAVVNVAGLIGLAASFFAVVYAYSRQVFALSRAGYLPRALSATNRHQAPWAAILVPGGIAFALCLTSAGDQLYVLLIFAALASYLLMFASHLKLRTTRPDLLRPFRTPGGQITAGIGLMLTVVTLTACFAAQPKWSSAGIGVFLVTSLYFAISARHRINAQAPEEEFARLKAAEASLG